MAPSALRLGTLRRRCAFDEADTGAGAICECYNGVTVEYVKKKNMYVNEGGRGNRHITAIRALTLARPLRAGTFIIIHKEGTYYEATQ